VNDFFFFFKKKKSILEFTSKNIDLGAIKIDVLYEEDPYNWLFIIFFTIYKTCQRIFTFHFIILEHVP